VKGRLVLVAACAFAAAGCGTGQGLELTRTDGSQVVLRDQVRAWCGAEDPFSAAAGQPRALHFAVGAYPPKRSRLESYVLVSHRIADLRRSHAVRAGEDEDLPTAYVFDATTHNEVASNLHGAHGTVRFRDVSCRAGHEVRVSLDTVLVSENGAGRPVRVRGDIRARIGSGQ
jgi:hypothetical protein